MISWLSAHLCQSLSLSVQLKGHSGSGEKGRGAWEFWGHKIQEKTATLWDWVNISCTLSYRMALEKERKKKPQTVSVYCLLINFAETKFHVRPHMITEMWLSFFVLFCFARNFSFFLRFAKREKKRNRVANDHLFPLLFKTHLFEVAMAFECLLVSNDYRSSFPLSNWIIIKWKFPFVGGSMNAVCWVEVASALMNIKE